ncbi:methyltransferase domain-containing protein [Nocardioides sp. ChNu-153]|uniref:methyltransferase domain-containing protein n=1 Tax=unclassified Nocardioides TaxID=2615069 RepID=UPI00240542F9|nr:MULTISPECIES: methyltransferase domain-containing protein [unclassified Nocardioides]MDF9715076.1 methyltransferase domain-containing protein [Nocardioides sp. ChNu-99]MDN7122345.1 methyltransferase domain-containing protein [Nocardioides sp. ChNu-153]
MPWDPTSYLQYADERGRPFVELLARVRAEAPRRVVDLGCGPGNLTALLARRWPGAEVVGIDSSPEMIDRARAEHPAGPPAGQPCGPSFAVGDVRTWRPERPVDVLVSNATLQWVPGHLDLLPDLLARVAPGGTLAFGVPGNFAEPSHVLRAELAGRAPYREHTRDIDVPAAHDAATYLQVLAATGAEVDAWETTYLHVLRGPDPVFAWVRSTGARPTLEALPDDLRERFADEFRAALRAAYPTTEVGGEPAVVLPFRRVFVVATRPGGTGAAGE